MTGSQGTALQRWSRVTVWVVVGLLLLLHLASSLLALFLCPQMLMARDHPGSHCTSLGSSPGHTNISLVDYSSCSAPGQQQTVGEGLCRTRGEGDLVRLEDLRLSFRFPGDGEMYSSWNWRLVASLAVNLRILAEDLPSDELDLSQLKQEVVISASLDYAPMPLLEQALSSDNSSRCLPSSPWHNLAIHRHVNRSLKCSLGPLRERTSSHQKAEFSFHCSIHPLFELSAISNSSYIMQIRLESSGHPGQGPNILRTNATVSSHLTVVTETEEYHHLVFYTKCFFAPILLVCLVWFIVRLCMNDLYVTIHDRLLITSGLAQLVANVPSEALMAASPSPFFQLVDPVAQLVLVLCLGLFWTVFTLDKLSSAEPWERTTLYYWRPLSILCVGGLIALLGLLYLWLPPLANPFLSHWSGGLTSQASVAVTLGLAFIAAAFQTYLSVLIFRVLCDISLRYPGSGHGLWRLKVCLAYCLLVSVSVCLSSLVSVGSQVVLHSNSAVHKDPLPFSVASSGLVTISLLIATNLHISALLLALSRAPGESVHDWYTPVRPVMYSPVRRDEQLHLWDLAAQPSPAHK